MRTARWNCTQWSTCDASVAEDLLARLLLMQFNPAPVPNRPSQCLSWHYAGLLSIILSNLQSMFNTPVCLGGIPRFAHICLHSEHSQLAYCTPAHPVEILILMSNCLVPVAHLYRKTIYTSGSTPWLCWSCWPCYLEWLILALCLMPRTFEATL